MNLANRFRDIYRTNAWASEETRSGGGSEMGRTVEIRELLPSLVTRLGARSLLDAGCGDWNWMAHVDLAEIFVAACDIVPEMIAENIRKYVDRALFFVADITRDPLPAYNAILCRTVLFHLSLANALQAVENFKRSGSTWLLATTHPHVELNEDIQDGAWRRLNLCRPPFNLQVPAYQMMDGAGDDGYLGVWMLR